MKTQPGSSAPFRGVAATLSADQTGVADITYTKIAFDTETYDIGGYFDAVTNKRWTPPNGYCSITVGARVSGTFAAGATFALAIYKNGTIDKQCLHRAEDANPITMEVTGDFICNGTDYFEAFVYADVGSGTATVVSGISTYFYGRVL